MSLITQTQNERKTNEYLDELAFLAETAGDEVVKRFTQKMDYPNTVTYVGKGKLQEIKEYLLQKKEEEGEEVGMVIFDDELSAKQIRNIEKELNVKILDRTSLILDIFAMRAQTANAKTQVELAQYKYMLPRLQRLWTHLERRVVVPEPEVVRVLLVFVDRVKLGWKWTVVLFLNRMALLKTASG